MKKLDLIWRYMKGYRFLYLLSIMAIGVATFIRFLWPMILRITVDTVIGGKPLEIQGWMHPILEGLYNVVGGRSVLIGSLWMCSIALILLTLSRGIFVYFKGKFSAIASESIIRRLRDNVYDHLQRLPFDYHVKAKTGDLIQRCTSDIDTIRRFVAMQFVEIGRALFMVGFALTFMIPMHLKMTIVSMALVPLIFLFSYIFFLKVKVAFKNSDESEGAMSTVLQENLTGVRVVRAFARQSFEIEKFVKKNNTYRDLTYRLIKLLAIYWSVSDFICLIQIGGVLILGTIWAAKGIITLGTMLAFSSYVGMLLWPVRQLGRVLTDTGKALVSIGRINEILSVEVEDQSGNLKFDKPLKGNIEFKNVSFGYDDDKQILKDISFSAKAGETVAILGPTGSGKSTLVNLLPRLYDYQSGSITIDGMELKNLDKKQIRSNIGIVLQEPFLFSRSISDNIKMAKNEAVEKEIYTAAKYASVHDVIKAFDKGYDTEIGERGVTLSGGQKQRVAMARTLINESPVMIFDDSLSAVDTETDAAIRNQLKMRKNKATTFIISHRINTMAEADKILVIYDGRIVQRGNHEELIKEEGLYKRIWRIQNELEVELSQELDGKDFAHEVTSDFDTQSVS